METFILIIIGTLGIALGFTLGRAGSHRHIGSFVNTERYMGKEHKKDMIVKHLRNRGELTNSDLQELLGVSDRTVVRYFDELEEEGIVVQKGKSGRGVHYELT